MAKDAATRRKHRRRRFWVYGGLLAGLWGFWVYQPMAFDLFPRPIPNPLPKIDPDSKHLFAKGTRISVVTAHPDDSEFYLGGTLLKLQKAGAIVSQVVLTDGDKGYYLWEDATKNRRVRRAEQTEASGRWGVKDLEFLGYPDGRLQVNDEIVGKVAEALRQQRPEYVLAFDDTYPPRMSHQDHRRSGTNALAAARLVPGVKWVLLYSTRVPNYVDDVSDYWDARLELLPIHKSQFYGKKLEGVKSLIEDSAITDAGFGDGTYGEGFRVLALSQ